jgi:hypothetical protein
MLEAQPITFRCQCGAVIRVRSVYAGRRGKCPSCAQIIVVPPEDVPVRPGAGVDTRISADLPLPASGAVFDAKCSICQCSIEPGESRNSCPTCHLPFHLECWQENRGCSAYGCPEVGILSPGPDIVIPPYGIDPIPDVSQQLPWEHLLLAGSVLAFLLGLITFGASCLACLAAGALITRVKWPALQSRLAVVLAGFICLGGFITGIWASTILWLG